MDAYAPCPCGSGKKLKFCCQEIVGEMEKIERLQENNQPRMALQLLEKIEKSHPTNPWIATHKGLALIDDQRSEEAAAGLLSFLRTEPNHPFANAVYAIASYNAKGYPAARKPVHRAFRRSIREFPGIVATLAARIAGDFLAQARYMAAREHMALALRIGTDEQRRQTLMALLELDGDASIPYPLRGAHHLPEFEAAEGQEEPLRKVRGLAACGCFREAADLLAENANNDDRPQVWHAIGLLNAYDGDESASATALHRAGEAYEEYEKAVECETLAQLFDQVSDENTAKLRMRRYRADSASRLLTLLDASDRLARVEQPEDSDEQRAGEPVGRYLILDRAVPDEAELREVNRETAPQSLARVTVFDRNDDDPTYVYVSGLEGEPLQQAAELLLETAGEFVTPIAADESEPGDDSEGEDEIVGVIPREHLAYYRNYYLPPKTPGAVRRRIQLGHWDSILGDDWINTPLATLGDRSPQAASTDSASRVKLAAAANVLDVFCGARGYICPISELRGRLGLPEPAPAEWSEGQSLNTLSLMEMQRVDLASLPDTQLQAVVQRAMLARHPSHVYGVLRYVLEDREGGDETPDRQELCTALVELCGNSMRRDEALEWVSRGSQLAEGGADGFEAGLQWKMRELMLRIDDPDDPERIGLLTELWQTYGAKLPSLREHLTELVAVLDIDAPWSTGILTPAGSGTAEDAWTGAESSAASAAEKKLWLPGDD